MGAPPWYHIRGGGSGHMVNVPCCAFARAPCTLQKSNMLETNVYGRCCCERAATANLLRPQPLHH
eukprot:5837641-Pyramimonas_sp.AAC.1